ncbi:MAG TPA: SgcJ/EcaC family oxidoreductase [Pseudonocardiaceae bacterium]
MTTTIDTTPVLDVLHRMNAAWVAADADAFVAEYVEDATVVLPGTFHQGRAAIRDFMADSFAGRLKGTHPLDEPKDVRVLGADTAIVVSRTGVAMAGEQDVPADRERIGTWVLTRQNGRWLVAAFANAPAH